MYGKLPSGNGNVRFMTNRSMNVRAANPTGIVIIIDISMFPLAIKQHATTYAIEEYRKAVMPRFVNISPTNAALIAKSRYMTLFKTVRFTVPTPIATAPITNGIVF